jgi:hypothetical protein
MGLTPQGKNFRRLKTFEKRMLTRINIPRRPEVMGEAGGKYVTKCYII